MLAYVLLSLLVFEHGLIQICFGIFEFLPDIFSIKFYTISFLWKHNFFFIEEKHTQWMLDTKVKVFQKSISCFMKWPWNCISWNALKEKFRSVSFPLEWRHPLLDMKRFYKALQVFILGNRNSDVIPIILL